MLSFVVSVANLGEEALPRKILLARANCNTAKGLIPRYRTLLSNLNLPDLCSLLSTSPKSSAWKYFSKNYLGCSSYQEFLEHCSEQHISKCTLKHLTPALHWKVTVGDSKLTRKRIRLLTGCDGLEHDAAHFRTRPHYGALPGDSSCKLCNAEMEDPEHFVSLYPSMSC